MNDFTIRDNTICQLTINILLGEIGVKFRLLSINKRFCDFKHTYCFHFSCHGNGFEEK